MKLTTLALVFLACVLTLVAAESGLPVVAMASPPDLIPTADEMVSWPFGHRLLSVPCLETTFRDSLILIFPTSSPRFLVHHQISSPFPPLTRAQHGIFSGPGTWTSIIGYAKTELPNTVIHTLDVYDDLSSILNGLDKQAQVRGCQPSQRRWSCAGLEGPVLQSSRPMNQCAMQAIIAAIQALGLGGSNRYHYLCHSQGGPRDIAGPAPR